jgi:Spy/CpxP family protein refolding chaperone
MTSPGRVPPKGPWLAVLVLLLVAFAGGIAGVAVDRLVLLPHRFGGRDWHDGRPGPPRGHGFRDRFARELNLSPEQQTRIDSIMDRQGKELRAVRGQVQPQLDSIITRTRREIDAILTPEQRVKAETIRKRFPPPPRGPDGPPGPPPDRP